MGRVPCRGGALRTTWGRSKGPWATLLSGSKVITPVGKNFLLLGTPHLLPDNLIEVSRGRRGRGLRNFRQLPVGVCRLGGRGAPEAVDSAAAGV